MAAEPQANKDATTTVVTKDNQPNAPQAVKLVKGEGKDQRTIEVDDATSLTMYKASGWVEVAPSKKAFEDLAVNTGVIPPTK